MSENFVQQLPGGGSNVCGNAAGGFHSQEPNTDTMGAFSGRNNDERTRLRPVVEIPAPYQEIFSNFPYFNVIQSTAFDDVLYTDNPIVVAAPTGSGKTVLFELAIIKHLMSTTNSPYEKSYKIVYLAPIKALCEERLVDWHAKFARFGVNCISVTGDSDNVDFQSLQNHNMIISTPEKWDSLTRRWKDNKKLVEVVKLFMLDEVHLLNEDTRGPTLEAVVSRMKTIQQSVTSELDYNTGNSQRMRFLALSATIPNAEDIAEWLGRPEGNAKYFKFTEDMRPVKLKKIVIGYPYNPAHSSPFKFDIMLNYKLGPIILEHSLGKPTLIFCSTRKSVEMTSNILSQNLTVNLNYEQKRVLCEAADKLTDHKIKQLLVNGVACHHAGILPENRKIIENLFRNGDLPILVTTSTLAMGVNLPAHLVIVKSTKMYAKGGYIDYPESAVFQMIGRAGRPQFDRSATAVILTTIDDKRKYENMVGGMKPVESNLHRHLTEHLNAEVVLHTITNLRVAMEWLTTTFLHIRAIKCPQHYGLPSGLSPDKIDKKLLEMCQIEINKLAKFGMLTIGNGFIVEPTETGILMAKYYLDFETMKLFTQINGTEILKQILNLVSRCHEFSEMYLRVSDKKCLNFLNSCRNQQMLRFPLSGKIKTLDMKINCIIQAVFGCMQIMDPSLLTESYKIMRIGERVTKCLAEYLETKENCFEALLNSLVLAKCFVVHLWENTPYVTKQLNGIGLTMSNFLVSAGKTTFDSIMESNPRDLERIINRKMPMGNTIIDQVRFLPRYQLVLRPTPNTSEIILEITLSNAQDLKSTSTANPNSLMELLVGDTSNRILLHEKYTHAYMIENPTITKKLSVDTNSDDYEVIAHFISDDWVGFDCKAMYTPKTKMEVNVDKSANKSSYVQQCLDSYMKKTKTPKKMKVQKTTPETTTSKNDDEMLVSSSKKSPTQPSVAVKPNETDSDLYKCLNSVLRRFNSKIFEQQKTPVKETTTKSTGDGGGEKTINELLREDVDDDYDLPDEAELPPNHDSDEDSFKTAPNSSFAGTPKYGACASRFSMEPKLSVNVSTKPPDFYPNFAQLVPNTTKNSYESTTHEYYRQKQPHLLDFSIKTITNNPRSATCTNQNLVGYKTTKNTPLKQESLTFLGHFEKTPPRKLYVINKCYQTSDLNDHTQQHKKVKLGDYECHENTQIGDNNDAEKDVAICSRIDEIWGNGKSDKKLTWRSPLVISSPVNKHSPPLNTSTRSEFVLKKTVPQDVAILSLPLSDDAAGDTFVKPNVFEKPEVKTKQVDYYFLENFVSSPLLDIVKSNTVRDNVKKVDNPTDYYTKLKYSTPRSVKRQQNCANATGDKMGTSVFFHSQPSFLKENSPGRFLQEKTSRSQMDPFGDIPRTNQRQQNQRHHSETLPFFHSNRNTVGSDMYQPPTFVQPESEAYCNTLKKWPSFECSYPQNIFTGRPDFCEQKPSPFGSERAFRQPFACLPNVPNHRQYQMGGCNCHHDYYKCYRPPVQYVPQQNYPCGCCNSRYQQKNVAVNDGKDFIMERFLHSVPKTSEEFNQDYSEYGTD